MRRMRKGTIVLATIAGAIIALPAAMTSAAHADRYKWCAYYGSRGGGGATNCGFVTFQQCQATVSGIGGFCELNPRYTGPERRSPRRVHRHYHSEY